MPTGRMRRDELAFIEDNARHMTPEEIARKLNRDTGAIMRHIAKKGLSPINRLNYEVQAEYDIKDRPYWFELTQQFSPEEINLFLYHWKQIVAQFRRDVLATEELQIIDLIKLEVLSNRALREQSEAEQQIRDLEKLTKNARGDRLFEINEQIVNLKSIKDSLAKEYKELLKQKSGMMKDLKATRDQRVKQLEGNTKTFAGMVTQLMTDRDFYEECGRQMELMRMAVEAEKKRLSDYHTYIDGEVDQPILTSETVLA